MASGKKCDKCGTFGKHDERDWMDIEACKYDGSWIKVGTYDLCPQCADKFKLWLDANEEV